MPVLLVESPSGGVVCVRIKLACAMGRVPSGGVVCVRIKRACAMVESPSGGVNCVRVKRAYIEGNPEVVVLFV